MCDDVNENLTLFLRCYISNTEDILRVGKTALCTVTLTAIHEDQISNANIKDVCSLKA